MRDERDRAVAAAAELSRRLSGPTVAVGIAEALESLIALLPAPESRFTADERAAFAAGNGDIDARGTHPARGVHSPQAASVHATPEGLVIRFDVRHEGVPGVAHGSFVAGFFDVSLGLVAIEEVGLGVTAELTVQFKKPVPLERDVLYRGRVVRREGRQTWVEGAAVLLDQPTVELATGSIRFVHPKIAAK